MEEKTKRDQKKENKTGSQASEIKISLAMLAVIAVFILTLVFTRFCRG